MKKKLLSLMLAMILIVGAFPMNKISADYPSWFTEDAIKQLIPDEVFAHIVYEAVASEAENYSGLIELLEGFDGVISYSSKTNTIKSIVGINYLRNTLVQLTNQDITDLSPLNDKPNGKDRVRAVNISGSPIQNWPENFQDLVDDTYSIPTAFYFTGNATYLFGYGNNSKTQTIVYDVTKAGTSATINTTATYTVSGNAATTKGAPETTDTTAVFTTTGIGKASARIPLTTWNYKSADQPQSLTPVYNYTLDSKYYYQLLLSGTATYTGAVYLAKYDTEDTQFTTPIPGARYALYRVGTSGDEYIDVYETGTEEILITGLTAGSYYFIETLAPAHYSLNPNKIEFTIGSDSLTGSISGLLSSVTVNKDTASWKPNWQSGFGGNITSSKPAQLTTTDTQTVNASDITNCVGFFDGSTIVSNLTLGESTDFDGTVTWHYGGADYTAAADVITAVQSKITDIGTGNNTTMSSNIEVTYTAAYTQKTTARQHIKATDSKITIWVENTTGDSDVSTNFSLNDGGKVQVIGYSDTNSAVSSDGSDNNNNNRKPTNSVQGVADVDNNWRVDIANIKVGSRGTNGSGAEVKIYTGKDEDSFTITDPTTNKTIKGSYSYDISTETVVITIEDMDHDIDVAIPFKRSKLMIDNITKDYDKNGKTDDGGYVNHLDDPLDRDIDTYEWDQTAVSWEVLDSNWRHGAQLVIKVFDLETQIEDDKPVSTLTVNLTSGESLRSAESIEKDIRKVWPNATVTFEDKDGCQSRIILVLEDSYRNMPYATEVDVYFTNEPFTGVRENNQLAYSLMMVSALCFVGLMMIRKHSFEA